MKYTNLKYAVQQSESNNSILRIISKSIVLQISIEWVSVVVRTRRRNALYAAYTEYISLSYPKWLPR